ncbi:hypothetical protein J3A64_004783 [Pseudarthrobacter sp. PvP004]|uniref:hypothetical protein n=1 Tax=Pseudarthrobacter sp. PvP004 TaxID=2817850 RepID=UPI001AE6D979|nr:hypothetical protein [Pseudarthrobacter sp. PvP004]MBP2269243.1 hypothetical protein [Pseudarthrobacter sp. PvP004]
MPSPTEQLHVNDRSQGMDRNSAIGLTVETMTAHQLRERAVQNGSTLTYGR